MDDLMRLIEAYADAQVTAALERTKDPWTSYGMGCIERREKAEAEAKALRKQIREAIRALPQRP